MAQDPTSDREQLLRQFTHLVDNMSSSKDAPSELPEWVDLDDSGIPGGTQDKLLNYEELILNDGRILRRYDNGAVRIENPISGIIQEERPDGSLIISLPSGKTLIQKFRGEPLLIFDGRSQDIERVARVCSAQLPGSEEYKFVFHFEDEQGAHLIELESLRYYRLRKES